MKGNHEFNKELEKLFSIYETEVIEAKKKGMLTESTARTYLLHSGNFINALRNYPLNFLQCRFILK